MHQVFIGGIHMEANSFNPVFATKETFTCQLTGKEMETMRGTSLELGGVYDCLDNAEDVQVVPGFFAQALTSGPVKTEDFDFLCGRLFESLRNAKQVDGVLLVLHGAMQSERIDDCEGYIISCVREIVGDAVPVCASFDFHALLTRRMMEGLDGLSGYFTYPHVDHFETGKRAAEHMLCLLRTGKKPYKLCRRIPLIMSCENSNTTDSPMVPAMNQTRAILKEEGVLSGSIFLTQPWLDSPELGCSVCLFVEDEATLARVQERVDDVLRYIWDKRAEFYPPMASIPEAMQRIRTMQRPVIFVDYGDVPNAGSTGDGTAVLRALIEAKLDFSAAVVIADAESTDKAVEIGEGNIGQFEIGGFGETGAFNARISVQAKVLKLNAEPFVHIGPAQKGFVSKPGMRALLQIGNIFVILCRQVCFSHDRNILITMGVQPEELGVVVMRATHTFFSCYAGVMGSWLYVDTPGFSTRDLKTLPFHRCTRPIYPLDEIVEFFVDEVM